MQVVTSDVEEYLPHVIHQIKRGVARSPGLTVAGVLDDLREGNTRLWISGESIAVVEMVERHDGKTANIVLGAGRLEDQPSLTEAIEQWARYCGAVAVEAHCRPGWGKVLDWKRTQVVLRKEFNGQ